MPNVRVLLFLVLSVLALLACSSSGSPGNTRDSGGGGNGGQGATLAAVRARGSVKCGITQGAGFATADDAGHWRGFDTDFCRALAAALFNDPSKAQFIPYTQQQ